MINYARQKYAPTHPVTTAQQDTPFEEGRVSCTCGLQYYQLNTNFLEFLHKEWNVLVEISMRGRPCLN